jgi:hypothetical protein
MNEISKITMNGIERIAAERERQIRVEGFDDEHDDELVNGELADGAACYCIGQNFVFVLHGKPKLWQFEKSWWKPSENRIRDLEKAGAMIAAEIDRLLRIEEKYKKMPETLF